MPLLAPLVLALLASAAGAALTGCAVPYAVGSTAETVRPGQLSERAAFQFASGQPDESAERAGQRHTTASVDTEVRFGLDAVSDAGVRITTPGGVVASYKRRIGALGPARLAGMAGAGVVGVGTYGHLEATLVASAAPGPTVAPYGGVRIQGLLPLGEGAPDVPLMTGVFGGVRLGRGDLAIHPELGLFYAPNDLLGESDWIVVPSLTVHGDDLLRALGVKF